jgi:GTP cyclohydrolase I
MLDIQSLPDSRQIRLNAAGVSRLSLPLQIRMQTGAIQPVVAKTSLQTSLPAEMRGTHMSRLVTALHLLMDQALSFSSLTEVAQQVQRSLGVDSAELRVSFRLFLPKRAPISGTRGLLDYECELRLAQTPKLTEQYMTVCVPILVLCPCSKAISEKNAHNQRALVTLQAAVRELAPWEELIKLVERHASAEIYSIIKRADEKFVTEHAYEHAQFVEDVVRDVALELRGKSNVIWYGVECESIESIHNHNAYASFVSNENGRSTDAYRQTICI